MTTAGVCRQGQGQGVKRSPCASAFSASANGSSMKLHRGIASYSTKNKNTASACSSDSSRRTKDQGKRQNVYGPETVEALACTSLSVRRCQIGICEWICDSLYRTFIDWLAARMRLIQMNNTTGDPLPFCLCRPPVSSPH